MVPCMVSVPTSAVWVFVVWTDGNILVLFSMYGTEDDVKEVLDLISKVF